MQKRKILFLGETYRADAITWMNGLKEFGNFEIVTWELNQTNLGLNRIKRIIEWILAVIRIKKIVKSYKPDMIIAERTTSYGFLATFSGMKPTAVAQQGITDIWPPNSKTRFFKKKLQDYTFKHADLLHAWGKLMATHMKNSGTDMNKVMVLPKGINLKQFVFVNNGNQPLIITSATGSCGCTVPSFPKDPIAPGEKSVIGVKYDTSKQGAFTKNVTIKSNAVQGDTKVLTIKGNVLPADPAPAPATPVAEPAHN